ncbi:MULTISPECIES: sarcosine oxidase subunit gamma [unclassified Janthinobacterium]|uniref:sarcosine oxidase subunit gamma n=1 Tax=unclassified Janthinobacterium TaxID=2610881 RepID=UPI000347A214|nr:MULTISPECIES: sarcosine oxidase subunit gamma family protein [unclassified Janthinobacterium]MEC5158901.1 sarcosine oxidase subunit gamma [Janthinobacterium sp. CG_S6]
MFETLQRAALPGAGSPAATTAASDRALLAGWHTGLAIVNLRGNADDPAFRAAVAQALNLELPVQPCTSVADAVFRLVWAGPDEWFVVGPKGRAAAIEARLRTALAGIHHAVTDVSGGYTVLHLSGPPVREVLAQGCPLDLHPRVFQTGSSAGSLFFKTSVWLWQTDAAPTYEVLVRSSFTAYFWLMLERGTQECGLVRRRFL